MARRRLALVIIVAASLALGGCRGPQVVPVDAAARAALDSDLPAELPALLALAAEPCAPRAVRARKSEGLRAASKAARLAAGDPAAQLALARCAFAVADFEESEDKQVSVAQIGAEAARLAGADAQEPRASYYLALTLGLIVQHQGLMALPKVPRILSALEAAKKLPEQDLGGPLRVQGMLYLKAPAWPAGPGDLEASLELLQRAAEQYPEHPQNHLFRAQALKESGDAKGAAAELAEARRLAIPERWGDYAARWQAEIAAIK